MDRMKHGLRALGVLLVVVLAGCTDATPTPTAADIPDEPEAPPNTTTPLGDPINPDPPQPPPNSTHWQLRVSGNDSCGVIPVFATFAGLGVVAFADGTVDNSGGTWSLRGIRSFSRTSLVVRSQGSTYEYILLTEFPPEVLSGNIESYSLVSPELSCSGTGGTFSRTPRYIPSS